MGTTSGVLWILILKDQFENQITGRFFPISLSLFSVSFFLKGEFNVTDILFRLKHSCNLTTDCIFKERENNFVMCFQTLGQTSLTFVFYNPMIFHHDQLNNQFNNKQIIAEFEWSLPTFHFS